ncbi:SIR2 family protein [Luteolibacter ambystomatis]|uniref:SIR2 family protein n=2 Tax=Luteolibacter ambystomatis TaxID=2824561 RepID=A0A975J268_9BACT|nr:SIR2 family protein [Luteolibacter ambystomatis]
MRNERAAVVERLSSFNIEPVNAEGWTPNGSKSWDRIEPEIESSDIFVLILGASYGWIPDEGPKASLGISVTHLEFTHAQQQRIPVIPFLKRLEYDTDRTSEDSIRRDAFRKEVQNWNGGYFTSEFELAADLATKVGEALVGLLTDEFQKAKVRSRSVVTTKMALALDTEPAAPHRPPILPIDLIDAVRHNRAILFAGSGISLAAGLPSASAFAESFIQSIRRSTPGYSANPTGAAFAGIATDLEASHGRNYLLDSVVRLIDSPQGIEPTIAHKIAVSLFSKIITTNYDTLFESAAVNQGVSMQVLANELSGEIAQRSIIKLHGSYDSPESLLLTEREVFMFDRSRSRLWDSVKSELSRNMVIVVGASLHDPSIIRLFSEIGQLLGGYFIAPKLWDSTPERLRPWNLKCIETEADSFMIELSKCLV